MAAIPNPAFAKVMKSARTNDRIMDIDFFGGSFTRLSTPLCKDEPWSSDSFRVGALKTSFYRKCVELHRFHPAGSMNERQAPFLIGQTPIRI
jgi:hypothetical protein